MSVRKVALLVSVLWLMASAPLVLTSCSEDERVATPDTSHTSDAAPDTSQSFHGEISDWKEEKGEVTPVEKSEKGGAL